jgi:hypothetical protein
MLTVIGLFVFELLVVSYVYELFSRSGSPIMNTLVEYRGLLVNLSILFLGSGLFEKTTPVYKCTVVYSGLTVASTLAIMGIGIGLGYELPNRN